MGLGENLAFDERVHNAPARIGTSASPRFEKYKAAAGREVERALRAKSSPHSNDKIQEQPSPTREGTPESEVVVDLSALSKHAETPTPRTVALQSWEGHVTKVTSDSFYATLVDQTAGSNSPEEIAQFDIGEVSEPDRPLLEVDAVFNWIIGYETSPSGTRKRVSYMYFRRLPAFRKADLDRSKQEARELSEFLNDASQHSATNTPGGRRI